MLGWLGQQRKLNTSPLLVVAGWICIVKVTVWVNPAEYAQTQPTEVLFTWGTGHLVAAIHFLQIVKEKEEKESKSGSWGDVWRDTRDSFTMLWPAGGASPVYLFHSEGNFCSSPSANLCCRTPPLLFGWPFSQSVAPWTFYLQLWLTGTRLWGSATHLQHGRRKTGINKWISSGTAHSCA